MRVAPALLLLLFSVAACDSAPPPRAAGPAGAPAQQIPVAEADRTAPAPPPAAAPSTGGQMPAAAQPEMAGISGQILETMDSGGYTYLRLKTAQGDVWAAVQQTAVKKGDTVSVVNAMPMEGFESKTLKRKFDVIYFGMLGGGAAAAPAAMDPKAGMAQAAAAHAAAASKPVDVGDVKVAKAEGADARTVAEVYGQKAALKDKPVTIRGKVVKFLPGIMGRNWIHLRDGSGSEGKDNDLVVTTNDSASVGDVVIVKGLVHNDRDFGAGYAYGVIVEEAKLSK